MEPLPRMYWPVHLKMPLTILRVSRPAFSTARHPTTHLHFQTLRDLLLGSIPSMEEPPYCSSQNLADICSTKSQREPHFISWHLSMVSSSWHASHPTLND